jgi:endonuclease YncB( thermonuclease family)
MSGSVCKWGWLLALGIWLPGATATELHSYALVQEDGSLLIQGRRVYLDGIYIPDTDRQCRTFERPVRCSSRAVLALDFKVQGFIRCLVQSENDDASLNAVCYSGSSHFATGEDLGAYLIKKGWALAGPDAPFEYRALERIAERNGLGVWGFPVDRIVQPQRAHRPGRER